MTVQMERIRNDYGAGRLGVHVRDGISKALHGAGLGHYPDEGLDGSPLVGISGLRSGFTDSVVRSRSSSMPF